MNSKFILSAREKFKALILPNLEALLSTEVNDVFLKFTHKPAHLSKTSLKVSASITPRIEQSVETVCERLSIPRASIEVYVFPGSDIAGYCYVNTLPIVVGISSELIKTMDFEEINFVLGHEIGHAFFKDFSNISVNDTCLEDLVIQRSIELTVDRIGLLATDDINSAFKAILKTLSGLDSAYLRFDFSNFLSEVREVLDENITDEQVYSSHPPLAQRFKALASFSTSDEYIFLKTGIRNNGVSLDQINKLISTEVSNGVDHAAYKKINYQIINLLIWFMAVVIINKEKVNLNSFSSKFEIPLDKSELEKAVNFINSYPESQRSQVLTEKISEALASCAKVSPRRLSMILEYLRNEYPMLGVGLNSQNISFNINR